MTNSLAGTGTLVRLALRRDRIILPAWVFGFVSMAAVSTSATIGLFPTVESRISEAASLNGTPALVAMYGKVYDATSLGSVAMIKMGGFGSAMVALLSIILVGRHTRAEEESGRLELLGATVVGRYAPLVAALTAMALANIAVGGSTAIALIAVGLPVLGSFGFGIAWIAVGLAFGAAAGVAVQLSRSAHMATTMSVAFLGIVYLLRAIGDTAKAGGLTWLTWLSPIGWGQQLRPFAGERWWVLVVFVAFTIAAVASGVALSARRDLGAGIIPDRPGPGIASARLNSPLALAWRMQRGTLLAWTIGFGFVGYIFGGIASSVGSLLDSPQAREWIMRIGGEKGLTDAFLATELSIMGLIASAYGVMAMLRLHSEESSVRAEPLLATSVSRTRWVASHLILAVGGTAVIMMTAGLTAGIAHAARTGRAGEVLRVFGAALVQLPAQLVVIGIVLAAFGIASRLAVLGWGCLVTLLFVGELGPMIPLNQWAMDVSPFTHVPKLPGPAFHTTPLIALTAVAIALGTAGLVGFSRRDVG